MVLLFADTVANTKSTTGDAEHRSVHSPLIPFNLKHLPGLGNWVDPV